VRRLLLTALLLLGACALPSRFRSVAPADSTHHHGNEFTNLVVAALLVVVLIPALVTKHK
jgi:hypothetical protein